MRSKENPNPEREIGYGEIFRRGILTQNPVLIEAVGLCPIAAVASSTKVAIILAAVSGVLLLLGEILASVLYKYLPRWLRIGIYAVTFIAAVVPMSLLTEKYMPNIYISVGVFLPLMAVNTLLTYRCDTFAAKNRLGKSIADAIACSIGYALVIVAVGAIREILGKGMFWEIPLTGTPPVPAIDTPFGGFLVMAFLSAFLWAMIARRSRAGQPVDSEQEDDDLDEEEILAGVRKVSTGVVETAVGVSAGLEPNSDSAEQCSDADQEGGRNQ